MLILAELNHMWFVKWKRNKAAPNVTVGRKPCKELRETILMDTNTKKTQSGHYFADGILKFLFLSENVSYCDSNFQNVCF